MRLRVLVVVLTSTLALAGCSARQRQAAWCAYHVSRLVHDVRTNHMGWAAFQGVMSAHHCHRAATG